MISSSPGIGHLYPTVSTAWALRAAGHDVLVATGGNHELAAQAGLQVVDAAPGVDFAQVFRDAFVAAGAGDPVGGPPVQQPTDREFVGGLFATVSRKFTDETVRLARTWRPDLVLFTPLQAAGPLAARVVGVPAVMHGIGIGHTADIAALLAGHFTDEYERFGATPASPAAVLDVSPPSMRAGADTWSMRYVPYNGGAVLPGWVQEPRERPRVTVTLGSVVSRMAGMGMLAPFIEAADSVAAEFVVALGGADPSVFGTPPANVRLAEWVPFNALFAASDAVIHHGGAGTTLTALDAGLPQLVLPQGADQFNNAAAVAKAGAGVVIQPEELDVDRVTELLADTPMREAAETVSAEIAGQPAPVDLVPRIIALAS
jgi:UDP:flavonoid glycosyltransferase YjiC (YdhE family)